ncbi:cation diffusion facilitator family transporter [Sulfurospirillum sp. 1307]|jgi:cation diffusion facilitator family transporter
MTLQKKATVISSATATLLIIIKLAIGILSGSVAVLASAIDSVLDLIVSAFNYFAINKSEQPANETFNYGKGKIEALAAVIEGTVITVSGIFIFYQAIKKAYVGDTTHYLDMSILVMLISLVITIALVMFLNYVAKKTNNMVIKSDALHYKTDVLSNGAILISLVLVYITNLDIIDAIMGVAISIYIIYSAYEIIKEGVYILLDAALEDEIVDEIKNIIDSEDKISSYHYLKTRKSGNTNFVDVHLVFNEGISLLKAHSIGDKIEDKIMKINPEAEWVINAHLDPYDDSVMNDIEGKN